MKLQSLTVDIMLTFLINVLLLSLTVNKCTHYSYIIWVSFQSHQSICRANTIVVSLKEVCLL